MFKTFWDHRRLFALGGGGRRGIAPAVEVLDEAAEDPSKLVPPVVLLRPGMLIENVWPSFKV